jgi:hypothetical protein
MGAPRTEPTAGGPILSERQAAEILGVAEMTLAWWRRSGRSAPPHIKFNGCIRYMRDQVVAWAASFGASNTNETVEAR